MDRDEPGLKKTVIIIGFGPGVGTSAARKFGAEGFRVALIARSPEKLDAAVAALKANGIDAAGFAADAGHAEALRDAIRKAQSKFGPISVLLWNAFVVGSTGDLMKEDPAVWINMFSVVVIGLLAAVDELRDDLKAAGNGAVLVTNGASWELSPEVNGLVVELGLKYPREGALPCAIGNAARHRLVGLLALILKSEGIYVGEVTTAGAINNTPTAELLGWGIDPDLIVEKLWSIYQAREEHYTRVAYEPGVTG
jgi:NAD(P)-dependent dehydrogenase (short-subunit alcohol dehydrogenase family)